MLVAHPSAAAQARKRLLLSTVLALAAVLIAYLAATYREVAREAQLDETRHADAIVVFGAAEYAGKPSPVYRARLDHAADLFRQGIAPIIITTGGAGRDPRFSEGQVGRSYLAARGIPEGQLIAETQSGDTLESARRVATIMRENGMQSCLAASDGYHMFRVKRMLRAQGVTVYGAPRPDPRGSSPLALLDEVFKYTLWKLHLE
ncbi:MAG TPA: YdcF family protein [Terriglobales bacterium]|nr:YdcF family protein [Terriglobales bacterium]